MTKENSLVQQLRQELIELGAFASARSWVPATSGNFSQRINSAEFIITASGPDKGALTEADFVVVPVQADDLSSIKPKPSAETLLHSQLYRFREDITAVAHIHSRHSVLVSKHSAREELLLSNYELLKAISSNKSHETRVRLPIFKNTQNIEALAREVELYMQEENPELTAYLIEGHGLYTWAQSMTELKRHLEAYDSLLDFEWERIKLCQDY